MFVHNICISAEQWREHVDSGQESKKQQQHNLQFKFLTHVWPWNKVKVIRQLKLFDTAVTLKGTQGHWKWYELVSLNE